MSEPVPPPDGITSEPTPTNMHVPDAFKTLLSEKDGPKARGEVVESMSGRTGLTRLNRAQDEGLVIDMQMLSTNYQPQENGEGGMGFDILPPGHIRTGKQGEFASQFLPNPEDTFADDKERTAALFPQVEVIQRAGEAAGTFRAVKGGDGEYRVIAAEGIAVRAAVNHRGMRIIAAGDDGSEMFVVLPNGTLATLPIVPIPSADEPSTSKDINEEPEVALAAVAVTKSHEEPQDEVNETEKQTVVAESADGTHLTHSDMSAINEFDPESATFDLSNNTTNLNEGDVGSFSFGIKTGDIKIGEDINGRAKFKPTFDQNIIGPIQLVNRGNMNQFGEYVAQRTDPELRPGMIEVTTDPTDSSEAVMVAVGEGVSLSNLGFTTDGGLVLSAVGGDRNFFGVTITADHLKEMTNAELKKIGKSPTEIAAYWQEREIRAADLDREFIHAGTPPANNSEPEISNSNPYGEESDEQSGGTLPSPAQVGTIKPGGRFRTWWEGRNQGPQVVGPSAVDAQQANRTHGVGVVEHGLRALVGSSAGKSIFVGLGVLGLGNALHNATPVSADGGQPPPTENQNIVAPALPQDGGAPVGNGGSASEPGQIDTNTGNAGNISRNDSDIVTPVKVNTMIDSLSHVTITADGPHTYEAQATHDLEATIKDLQEADRTGRPAPTTQEIHELTTIYKILNNTTNDQLTAGQSIVNLDQQTLKWLIENLPANADTNWSAPGDRNSAQEIRELLQKADKNPSDVSTLELVQALADSGNARIPDKEQPLDTMSLTADTQLTEGQPNDPRTDAFYTDAVDILHKLNIPVSQDNIAKIQTAISNIATAQLNEENHEGKNPDQQRFIPVDESTRFILQDAGFGSLSPDQIRALQPNIAQIRDRMIRIQDSRADVGHELHHSVSPVQTGGPEDTRLKPGNESDTHGTTPATEPAATDMGAAAINAQRALAEQARVSPAISLDQVNQEIPVIKGDSDWKIADQMLKDAGVQNPTDDQRNRVKDLLEAWNNQHADRNGQHLLNEGQNFERPSGPLFKYMIDHNLLFGDPAKASSPELRAMFENFIARADKGEDPANILNRQTIEQELIKSGFVFVTLQPPAAAPAAPAQSTQQESKSGWDNFRDSVGGFFGRILGTSGSVAVPVNVSVNGGPQVNVAGAEASNTVTQRNNATQQQAQIQGSVGPVSTNDYERGEARNGQATPDEVALGGGLGVGPASIGGGTEVRLPGNEQLTPHPVTQTGGILETRTGAHIGEVGLNIGGKQFGLVGGVEGNTARGGVYLGDTQITPFVTAGAINNTPQSEARPAAPAEKQIQSAPEYHPIVSYTPNLQAGENSYWVTSDHAIVRVVNADNPNAKIERATVPATNATKNLALYLNNQPADGNGEHFLHTDNEGKPLPIQMPGDEYLRLIAEYANMPEQPTDPMQAQLWKAVHEMGVEVGLHADPGAANSNANPDTLKIRDACARFIGLATILRLQNTGQTNVTS